MANSEMRPFKPEEVKKIMEHYSGHVNEYRNKSLIALGICTGFRISELLALRIEDVYYFGKIKDQIKLPRRLMKGKQPRHPKKIFPEAKKLLLIWINQMIKEFKATRRSFLFVSREGGSISPAMAWRIIKDAARKTGIGTDGIGTHSLRKTFANAVYDYWDKEARAGARIEPMRKVQMELGHATIEDTYSYMKFILEDKPDDVFEKYEFLFDGDKEKISEIKEIESML